MNRKFSGHGDRQRPYPRDLSFVMGQGAKTRRHKYFKDVQAFFIPVLFAILLQGLIYALVVGRDSSPNWQVAGIICLSLSMVPLFSAFTLSAFRRHEAPILSALAVTLVLFSFATSFTSALRLPQSYLGLLLALPVPLTIMAFANVRFHRSVSGRVAILAFDGIEKLIQTIGQDAVVVSDPKANMAQFDIILIDPHHHYTAEWADLLTGCYLGGTMMLPWTRYLEIRQGRVDVGSFDVTHLNYSPSQMLYARAKRLLDVAAVVVTFPVTGPLALIVALYIFARDGGPVFFVQHRRGLGGEVFRMYKFRTMYNGTQGGATSSDDQRILPGCKFIRRVRLDELPQLWNIMRGDMSLIGPRPEAVDLAKWYSREIPQYPTRLLVQPGLTGWAQVMSGYTSNPDQARVKLSYDLYYIKHLSFDLDLQILFKTVRTVLFGAGAR